MKLDYVLTLHMNKFKIKIGEANIISETMKIVQENTGSKISDIVHSNILSHNIFPGKRRNEINKQMVLRQTKKILHSKGKH